MITKVSLNRRAAAIFLAVVMVTGMFGYNLGFASADDGSIDPTIDPTEPTSTYEAKTEPLEPQTSPEVPEPSKEPETSPEGSKWHETTPEDITEIETATEASTEPESTTEESTTEESTTEEPTTEEPTTEETTEPTTTEPPATTEPDGNDNIKDEEITSVDECEAGEDDCECEDEVEAGNICEECWDMDLVGPPPYDHCTCEKVDEEQPPVTTNPDEEAEDEEEPSTPDDNVQPGTGITGGNMGVNPSMTRFNTPQVDNPERIVNKISKTITPVNQLGAFRQYDVEFKFEITERIYRGHQKITGVAGTTNVAGGNVPNLAGYGLRTKNHGTVVYVMQRGHTYVYDDDEGNPIEVKPNAYMVQESIDGLNNRGANAGIVGDKTNDITGNDPRRVAIADYNIWIPGLILSEMHGGYPGAEGSFDQGINDKFEGILLDFRVYETVELKYNSIKNVTIHDKLPAGFVVVNAEGNPIATETDAAGNLKFNFRNNQDDILPFKDEAGNTIPYSFSYRIKVDNDAFKDGEKNYDGLVNSATIKYDTIIDADTTRSVEQLIQNSHGYESQVTVEQNALFDIPPLFKVGMTIEGKTDSPTAKALKDSDDMKDRTDYAIITSHANDTATLKPVLLIHGTDTPVSVAAVAGYKIPKEWEIYYTPSKYELSMAVDNPLPNIPAINVVKNELTQNEVIQDVVVRNAQIGIYEFTFSATMIKAPNEYYGSLTTTVTLEVIAHIIYKLKVEVEFTQKNWDKVRLDTADVAIKHDSSVVARFAGTLDENSRTYTVEDFKKLYEYTVDVYVPYGYDATDSTEKEDESFDEINGVDVLTRTITVTVEPVKLPFYRDIATTGGGR